MAGSDRETGGIGPPPFSTQNGTGLTYHEVNQLGAEKNHPTHRH